MKHHKTPSLKSKRAFAIAGTGLAVLAIGATIAYSQTIANFNNKFKLGYDKIKSIDIVPVIEDWAPCQEYPKTATVTNENDTPRYVRTKMNDYWRIQNSQQTGHETSDLPMTWTDDSGTHKYAFYNLQNEDKWTLASDGYYYYNEPLAPGATTESLIKSAEFNCDVNLGGDMSYSQDGKVAETIQSDYANSEYHVYVIFEISDEDIRPKRQTLYDIVAAQTKGSDVNMDYMAYENDGQPSDEGVYTFRGTENDTYPVHYFRGENDNNRVIFGGYCWRIMRTAEKGSVKLIFDSAIVDGQCPIVPNASVSLARSIGRSTWRLEDTNGSPTHWGYMWGNDINQRDWVYDHYPESYNEFYNYIKDGTIDVFQNETDSTMKWYIESWFEKKWGPYNISWDTHSLVENEDKLEDVPYCNDRSVTFADQNGISFGAFNRIAINGFPPSTFTHAAQSHNPRLDCPRGEIDMFTVSTENGNGKLKHKVALPTADELVLVGTGRKTYLNTYHEITTLTPAYFIADTQGIMYYDATTSYGKPYTGIKIYGTGYTPDQQGAQQVKPVVALIHNTYVASGNGTIASPYILEW